MDREAAAPWGLKEADTSKWLNWNEKKTTQEWIKQGSKFYRGKNILFSFIWKNQSPDYKVS